MSRALGGLALIMAGALLLPGCTSVPFVTIVNHSGMDIDIRGFDMGLEGYPEKIYRLGVGRSQTFKLATISEKNIVRVRARGCEHAYELPRVPDLGGFNEPALPLQVEPDLSVNLKWRARDRASPDVTDTPQPAGFPLRPTTTTCPTNAS